MEKISITTQYITLGALLKYSGNAEDGVMAKEIILDGECLVNGEVETRRGRKLYKNDIIKIKGTDICLVIE